MAPALEISARACRVLISPCLAVLVFAALGAVLFAVLLALPVQTDFFLAALVCPAMLRADAAVKRVD